MKTSVLKLPERLPMDLGEIRDPIRRKELLPTESAIYKVEEVFYLTRFHREILVSETLKCKSH